MKVSRTDIVPFVFIHPVFPLLEKQSPRSCDAVSTVIRTNLAIKDGLSGALQGNALLKYGTVSVCSTEGQL